MPELVSEWEKRLSGDEREAISGAKYRAHETGTLSAIEAMDYALLHSFERASVIREKDLLKTALIQSVGNASFGEVKRELIRDNILRKASEATAT